MERSSARSADELLQPPVLVPEDHELLRLRLLEPALALLPALVGLLRDPVPAADLPHCPRRDLLEVPTICASVNRFLRIAPASSTREDRTQYLISFQGHVASAFD